MPAIQPVRQPAPASCRELLPCWLLALAGVSCFLCHAILFAKPAVQAPPEPSDSLPAQASHPSGDPRWQKNPPIPVLHHQR